MKRFLNVYLLEKEVGLLTLEDGNMCFSYYDEYIETSSLPISVSMPLIKKDYPDKIARPFFSGFLPDENIRRKLAALLNISEKNSFGLLEVVGRECAGAVTLIPLGEELPIEDTNHTQELDETKINIILNRLNDQPLLAGDNELDVRLSLAGAQNKIALRIDQNNNKFLMLGGAPTTHIIKPLITYRDDVKDSVYNEYFCLRLANEIGLNTANPTIDYACGEPYLIIERYDRFWKGEKVYRQHQEDFCQALARPPEQKYQNEGGPNLNDCFDLLKKHSANAAQDRISLLKLSIFNFLIGNGDAHGKNFSFLYKNNKPSLAPAYDLLSTHIYEGLSKKMAMKIGGEYLPKNIYFRNWQKLVPETSTAVKMLKSDVENICQLSIKNSIIIKEELANKYNIKSDVIDKIVSLIKERSKKISF